MAQIVKPEILDASSLQRSMPSRIDYLPFPGLTPKGETVGQALVNLLPQYLNRILI